MTRPDPVPFPELQTLYTQLPTPDAGYFSATPIPGAQPHRLARGSHDETCLLIAVSEGTGRRPPALELEHLRVLYDVQCRIVEGSGAQETGTFTVIACTAEEPFLREQFLRIAAPTVLLLGRQPTRSDVAETVTGLARLFRAVSAPARASAQGLWGELFVMTRATKPRELIHSWRVEDDETFDFSAATQRMEVKAVAGGPRRHHFSLEQLSPPAGVCALIASVYVERAGAGTSLGELVDRLRDEVADDAKTLLRLECTVAETLGESFPAALSQRFDYQRALQTLRFYDAAEVPCIDRNVPEGVTQVRFVASLDEVPPADPARHRREGGLFAAALPA